MNILNKFTCAPSQLNYMVNMLNRKNTPPIIDYIRESTNGVNSYTKIKHTIRQYPQNSFAIKLSALGIQDSVDDCIDKTNKIIKEAKQYHSHILIDAENHEIQHMVNDVTDLMMHKHNQEHLTVYKTYQMYKKDALIQLINDLNSDRSHAIGIKLVRGAYLNQDKHLGVLCDNEHETHRQYDDAILQFVSLYKPRDQLLCATHNMRSVFVAKQYMNKYNLTNIEFAQLLGMSDRMSYDLQNNGYKTYKYLPYGQLHESIPYLLRRLYENYPMINYVKL